MRSNKFFGTNKTKAGKIKRNNNKKPMDSKPQTEQVNLFLAFLISHGKERSLPTMKREYIRSTGGLKS